jgi:hypothetical protein
MDECAQAQTRIQMQVVFQLEIQLQKERDRLQAMMHHLNFNLKKPNVSEVDNSLPVIGITSSSESPLPLMSPTSNKHLPKPNESIQSMNDTSIVTEEVFNSSNKVMVNNLVDIKTEKYSTGPSNSYLTPNPLQTSTSIHHQDDLHQQMSLHHNLHQQQQSGITAISHHSSSNSSHHLSSASPLSGSHMHDHSAHLHLHSQRQSNSQMASAQSPLHHPAGPIRRRITDNKSALSLAGGE